MASEALKQALDIETDLQTGSSRNFLRPFRAPKIIIFSMNTFGVFKHNPHEAMMTHLCFALIRKASYEFDCHSRYLSSARILCLLGILCFQLILHRADTDNDVRYR